MEPSILFFLIVGEEESHKIIEPNGTPISSGLIVNPLNIAFLILLNVIPLFSPVKIILVTEAPLPITDTPSFIVIASL